MSPLAAPSSHLSLSPYPSFAFFYLLPRFVFIWDRLDIFFSPKYPIIPERLAFRISLLATAASRYETSTITVGAMKTIVEILMIFLHLFRFPTFIAMLIMNSVFLGMMKAHNIPVNKNIVITEVFAAVGAVVDILGLLKSCVVLGSDEYLSNLPLLCAGVVLRAVEIFIMGCCIFIAVVYKAGAGDCDSYADTPFGDVKGEDGLTGVGTSCRMQAATFAVSIIAAFTSFCIIFAKAFSMVKRL